MGNAASTGKQRKDTRKQDTIVSIVFLAVVVIGILLVMLYSSGMLENLTAHAGDRKVDSRTGKVVTGITEYNEYSGLV